jgi:hypothetical protein
MIGPIAYKRWTVLALVCGLAFFFVSRSSAQVQQPMHVIKIAPLPGGLNKVPVLNSNSPEVVTQEGILVSTLPREGKAHPNAHLDYKFNGRFDIFAHHIAKADSSGGATLYIGIALFNPSGSTRTVRVLQAGSYLSQPDAPFADLPSVQNNEEGNIFAGPGDRLMDDFLHGVSQKGWPKQVVLSAHETILLACLPIPVDGLTPPLNGRSTFIKLNSDGPVFAATLALFGQRGADGIVVPPSESRWRDLLNSGDLAGPREKSPSNPQTIGPVSFGRVAGVSIGSEWRATLPTFDVACGDRRTVQYPLSSVAGATLGTDQVQSADMAVREPDTAYAAHGNYAVLYTVQIPLINSSKDNTCSVAITFGTPLKAAPRNGELLYSDQPSGKPYFRGTVKASYTADDLAGEVRNTYVHLVQHNGERCSLFRFHVRPNQKRMVTISWYYPPDSTPPQALTLDNFILRGGAP